MFRLLLILLQSELFSQYSSSVQMISSVNRVTSKANSRCSSWWIWWTFASHCVKVWRNSRSDVRILSCFSGSSFFNTRQIAWCCRLRRKYCVITLIWSLSLCQLDRRYILSRSLTWLPEACLSRSVCLWALFIQTYLMSCWVYDAFVIPNCGREIFLRSSWICFTSFTYFLVSFTLLMLLFTKFNLTLGYHAWTYLLLFSGHDWENGFFHYRILGIICVESLSSSLTLSMWFIYRLAFKNGVNSCTIVVSRDARQEVFVTLSSSWGISFVQNWCCCGCWPSVNTHA